MGDKKGFEEWLPLSAKRIAPGEYEVVDREGRRLWFMEGAALAEWVCAVVNGCAVREAVEVEREACANAAEAIAGEMEAQGYGKAAQWAWRIVNTLRARGEKKGGEG